MVNTNQTTGAGQIRLNPFFYRSSVGPTKILRWTAKKCLNPFFYRSSVGRHNPGTEDRRTRLNPFFYRSSVGHFVKEKRIRTVMS